MARTSTPTGPVERQDRGDGRRHRGPDRAANASRAAGKIEGLSQREVRRGWASPSNTGGKTRLEGTAELAAALSGRKTGAKGAADESALASGLKRRRGGGD